MPLVMLQFGQQDQLGIGGHKKSIHCEKITLNVFVYCIPIFNNIWQNGCTIILKNTINFFLNSVTLYFLLMKWFYWKHFSQCFAKTSQFLAKYQEEKLTEFQYHLTKPLLYQPLKFRLAQLPHHTFHNVYQIVKCHRYVRFCKNYHNLLISFQLLGID